MATKPDTSVQVQRRNAARFPSLGMPSAVIAGASVAVVALYMIPLNPAARHLMGNVLLALLPAAAAVACGVAASRAAEDVRGSWILFGGAAGVVAVAQLAWIIEQQVAGPGPYPRPSQFLFPLFHPLFIAGGVLALRRDRIREVAPEIALDAVLVLLAGIIVVMRVSVGPLIQADVFGPGQIALTLTVQVLAIASAFVASLMVMWHSPALSTKAATGLFIATLTFAVGNVASGMGLDPDPLPGDAFDLVWVAGWAAFVWAAVAGARLAAPPTTVAGGERRMAAVFRRSIVPGIALFMALAVVDVAFNPPEMPSTVLLVALLGAVLAFRIGEALTAVERHAREERRFTHTRALIEVSHSMAGATDVDSVLNLVSVAARNVLGARASGIELLSSRGDVLESRVALGLPPEVVGMEFPLNGSFTGWVVKHGEARATVDPSADPFIHQKSLRFLGRSPTAAAPLRFGRRRFGALYAIRDQAFDADELELLSALAEQAATALENARLFEQVTALSLTDPLTGLANRRQLERDLAREFAAARRGRLLVAVMFDLDGFKQYNDEYGHVAGDEALKVFAEALKVETRAMNLAARYGGDEFLVLVSDTDEAGCQVFVDRVMDRFGKEISAVGKGPLGATAGWAAYDPAMQDWLALIEAADKALYRAKSDRAST